MVFVLCLTGKKTNQTNKQIKHSLDFKCAKDLVFQNYGFEIPGILIEIQCLVEILGFSFELIGFHLK